MKQLLRLALPIFVAIGVFIYAVTTTPVNAAQGTIYFSPNTGTYNPGASFTVEVRGTVPSNGFFGGGATINVTYPTNLLQATSTSISGGALGGSNPTINNGTISYSVFNYPSRAINDQKIFSITFKTLNTGAATLNFSTNTSINDGPTAKQPTTIAIVAPSCPAGQVGTPPNCSVPPPIPVPPPTPTPAPVSPPSPTPAPVSSPVPTPTVVTPDTSPPEQTPQPTEPAQPAESLSLKDIDVRAAYDSSVVNWATNIAATATFKYGTSAAKLDNTAAITSDETKNTFTTTLSKLQLGTTYHYSIVVQNTSNEIVSKNGTFTTKAYPVLLRVLQDTQPLSDAQLKIQNFDNTYTTSTKGDITLALMPGEYTAKITKDSLAEEQKFTIKALTFASGKSPDTQVIEIRLASPRAASSSTNPVPYVVGALIFLTLLGAAVAFIAWKRHRDSQAALGYQSVLDFDSAPPPEYNSYVAQATPDVTYQQPYTAMPQYAANLPEAPYQTAGAAPIYSAGPAYSPPTNTMLPAGAVPMNTGISSEDEPADMWSTAATQMLPTPNPAVESTAEDALEGESLAHSCSEPAEDLTITASQAQTSVNPVDERDYEYNDDNSITIHHDH